LSLCGNCTWELTIHNGRTESFGIFEEERGCLFGIRLEGQAQVVKNDAEEAMDSCKFPGVVFVVCKLYGGVATGEADAAKKQKFQLKRLDIKKGKEEQQ
jgi:hypothetical protein